MSPGTAFQEAVWRELRKIPPGETRSYAQIAAAVGKPGAVRAAGSANGANHVAVLIPCHRVVRSDGSLGGYAGGLERKRKLLAAEGHRVGCAGAPVGRIAACPDPAFAALRAERTGEGELDEAQAGAPAVKPLWQRILDFPLVALVVAIALFILANAIAFQIGKLLPPMDPMRGSRCAR